jgi:hypothetical protein
LAESQLLPSSSLPQRLQPSTNGAHHRSSRSPSPSPSLSHQQNSRLPLSCTQTGLSINVGLQQAP